MEYTDLYSDRQKFSWSFGRYVVHKYPMLIIELYLFLAEDDYDDDEQYRLFKRFLSHKSNSAGTSRPPSILENLIRTSSARYPTESKYQFFLLL